MIDTITSSSDNKKQGNIAKQTEAIGETITSNTDQLKVLGFTCSQYDEEYIDKLDKDIINKVRELMTRGVFGPQAKSDKKITVKRLQNIQSKFGILSYLHEKRLKMTPEILGTIENIETDDIYDLQVENFVKYKIEVTDANDLTEYARYNTHRQRIQGFIDSGYELTEYDFQHLNAYTPQINFHNLQKLNTLLGRKISIDTVITRKEDDDGLNGCGDMENFDWKWLTYLTKNQISIPDNRLRKFKYPKKINTNNFKKLIDNNIKMPSDPEIFDQMNRGTTFLAECREMYLYNHPREHTKEEITVIDEKFSKKSFMSITEFIQIYQQIEKELEKQEKIS